MTAGARGHRTPVLRWQIQRLRHYQNAMAASRPHRASHPGPDHCPLLGRLYWHAAQTFTLYPKKQARSLTSFFKGLPQNKIYHMNVPCDALRHERHSGYRFTSKDPFYSERSAAALVGRAGSTAVRAGRYPAHGGGEWPFQADCSQRGSRTSREAKTGRPARKGEEAGRSSETR